MWLIFVFLFEYGIRISSLVFATNLRSCSFHLCKVYLSVVIYVIAFLFIVFCSRKIIVSGDFIRTTVLSLIKVLYTKATNDRKWFYKWLSYQQHLSKKKLSANEFKNETTRKNELF